MKKINFIIIAFFIIFIIILMIYSSMVKRSSESQRASTTPFPTRIPPDALRKLTTLAPDQIVSAVSIEPANNSTDISLSSPIKITFNREVSSKDVVFSISPSVPVRLNWVGKMLIVQPSKDLNPGTLYAFSLDYNDLRNLPQIFSFTTVGPTKAVDSSYPEGMVEQFDDFQKQNNPDVFLMNKTPYTASEFSISGSFKTEPNEHFAFTVELTGPDKEKSKTNALNWITSLGLSEARIQSLDILYQ